MLSSDISPIAAFFAGLISFLSPCVLPLVLPYISYITGIEVEALRAGDSKRAHVLRQSILFCSGFTVVFVALGATASTFGGALAQYTPQLTIVAGAFILLMGIHMMGIFELKFMNATKVFGNAMPEQHPLAAFGLGLAFALGWTPCLGPVLAGILTLAAVEQSLLSGMILLLAYAMGLAVPFIAAAVMVPKFLETSNRIRPFLGWFTRISGGLLAIMGLLLLTGSWSKLSYWLLELFPILAKLG